MFESYPIQFGSYLLEERVGQGGMAEIFRAQTSGPSGFAKEVAIKRILSHLSNNEDFVNQFLDEARISGSLNHPNIVQIYDVSQVGENYYIAMEFINGRHLGQVIRRIAEQNAFIPTQVAVGIINEVAKALAFAHEARDPDGSPLHIIHRDISPQNIMISYHGAVKLTDFGIAKAANKIHQTTAGVIKGKFSYLAPEQLIGHPASPQSDLFALGIAFWETLTRRRLFQGQSDIETIQMVQVCKIPPMKTIRTDVPPRIEEILAKVLHRDPAQRYATAHAFVADLSEFLASEGFPEDMSLVGNFMMSLYPEANPLDKAAPPTEIGLAAIPEEAWAAIASSSPSAASDPRNAPTAAIDISPFQANGYTTPPTEAIDTSALQATIAEVGGPSNSQPPPSPPPKATKAAAPAKKERPASAQPSVQAASRRPSTEKPRTGLTILAVFLVLLLGAGGGYAIYTQVLAESEPSTDPTSGRDAEIEIALSPPQAELFVNGKAIPGQGPRRTISNLVGGMQYSIVAKLQGHQEQSRVVIAKPGQSYILRITLPPRP